MSQKHTNVILITIFSVIVAFFTYLIVWTLSLHRDAVLFARTRVQFLAYEAALRSYCLEYGEMPHFLGTEEPIWLNVEGNSELLIKALTGKNPDGTPLSAEDKQFLNPKEKNFYTFRDNEFLLKNGKRDHSVIVDSFNNPQICVMVESTLDTDVVIPKDCFPSAVQEYIPGEALNKQIVVFSLSRDGKKVIGNWDNQ